MRRRVARNIRIVARSGRRSNAGMSDSLVLTLLLVATFTLAGTVKGVTGMGLPTVAMALLGTLMSPSVAAALLVIPSLVTNIWQLLHGPHLHTVVQRLWPMMLAIMVSTLAGAALLTKVDARWSGFALGGVLVAYVLHGLLAPALQVPVWVEKRFSPAVGVVTGIVTGATGVSVIPVVPWLQSLDMERDVLVQAFGLSFTVSTFALAMGLWMQGAFALSTLGWSALSVLPALAGMWLGQKIRARISPRRFRQCLLMFLLLLGLQLLLQPLMSP